MDSSVTDTIRRTVKDYALRNTRETGFAYICFKDGLDVKTVSEDEVGAMVNALWCQSRIEIRDGVSEQAISDTFKKFLMLRGRIAPVAITENWN